MTSVIADLRYAIRGLRKSPGFTLAAVLTLGLGIGGTTTMFSVLNGVLLRPLPYPEPARLVTFAETNPRYHGAIGVTYPEFDFLRANATVFDGLTATTPVGFNLFAGDRAERVRGLRVASDYFRVLGARPALGQAFTAAQDQPDGPDVLVLSHGLWVRRFGGSRDVIGRNVLLDGRSYRIIGVMPADFQAFPAVALWTTIAQVGATIGGGRNLTVIGRLRPGLSLQQAEARMPGLTGAFRARFDKRLDQASLLDLMPYRSLVVEDTGREIGLLFGATALVLLIACANVAALVLGRTASRARELAVRAATGATRGRLARLLLTESLVLSLAGGLMGLLVARAGLRSLLALAPEALPRLAGVHLDATALGFGLALSLLTGMGFGLAPAWRSARTRADEALAQSAGRTTNSRRATRARGLLVTLEVALSLMLLVGAGLLLQSYARLMRVDPGFRTGHLLTAEVWLTGARYDSAGTLTRFYDRLTDRLERVPGVRSAAMVEAGLPLEHGGNTGIQLDNDPAWHGADYRTVTPGYFALLGVPLLRGRAFSKSDLAETEPVALVNASLARSYFGDSLAVGHFIKIEGVARRIVGMVGDVRSRVDQPAPPSVFLPAAQTPAGLTRAFVSWYPIHVLVRTAVAPEALRTSLRQAIAATDPAVPVGQVRTMDRVFDDALALRHFIMLQLALFAATALALAAVGIYGVMSNLMLQRTREIGIRMALGAMPGRIVRKMLGYGLRFVLLGAMAGLAIALALTGMLASQLYGVHPRSIAAFAGATAVLAGVALLAAWLPARRATRVDPARVLREE